jgi:hypothetical protein
MPGVTSPAANTPDAGVRVFVGHDRPTRVQLAAEAAGQLADLRAGQREWEASAP